jgi:prolyl oligopeptidase
MKKIHLLISILLLNLISQNVFAQMKYPDTPRIAVEDTLHNIVIKDDYRWLEDGEDPKVIKWEEEQEKFTRSILDNLPQREYLINKFNELWHYDDVGTPSKVLNGDRIFLREKQKDDEKWRVLTKENEDAEFEVLIDPNLWDPKESLYGTRSSRDGRYYAFGKTVGGDENPHVRIMEIETKKILPDTLRGRKQYVTSWLPDNSGLYYSACPLKGEVPEGEENYWRSIYFHKLGTSADEDEKIYYSEDKKEISHGVWITECGKYIVFYRGLFQKNEIYFKQLKEKEMIPIATGFDASYSVEIINDKILIKTDKDAPMYKMYITDVNHPGREYWNEFLPETKDRLWYFSSVAGYIYVVYQHNAYSLVKIYNLDGEYIRDLPFPTLGTGSVSGYWSQNDIWVNFCSFTYPSTIFKYDFESDKLKLYKEFPLDIDVENYTSEQVWYESKDGTPVSMFIIHRKDMNKNGENPCLLSGYGGFNVSRTPSFSTSRIVWLEAGGMLAIPNLRGGGEYGKKWHEAGKKEKRQNVFDDFTAAAEWLIENKYTNPEKLAISGGSNGGLLVGAVTVQRPELFKVVNCAVPLLDMIRYHKFGPARFWIEEYGSAEDPEQFKYLYKYSPYHNVINYTDYPAIIFTAGENDARVDPLHARKMVARLQEANPNGNPILLLVRKDSGHGGGTTLSMHIEQAADTWSFLMNELGMNWE